LKRLDITVIHDAGQKDSKGVDRPDAVVEQVVSALTAKGHTVTSFPVPADVKDFVTGILATKPELVFNLAETFGRNIQMEVHLGALLELMDIPFTGADLGGLFLAQDKVLTKKLLHFHGVKFPEFLTFAPDRIETGGNIGFPLFVKPARADSSLGITGASLVHDFKSLVERVEYIHTEFASPALAEAYIDGREYYLSVIGHLNPRVLSIVEMDFSGLPPTMLPVASYEAKWNSRTRAYKGTKSVIATNVSEELAARLKEAAREAYLALQLRDYGRVDIRVSRGGDVFVIEVNPNPYLARDAELAMAAGHSGIPYEDLIEQIVEWTWKRRRARKSGEMQSAMGTREGRHSDKHGEKHADRHPEKHAEKPAPEDKPGGTVVPPEK